MSRTAHRVSYGLIGALAIALVLALARLAGAGPLDPPGPPGSTDGARLPGTPISSIGFVISTPGHYYLTRNLTSADASAVGISINAGGVTLDLNGFTLSGTGTAGTGSGIVVAGPLIRNVVIENGQIILWSGAGLDGRNLYGSRVRDLNVSLNGSVGLWIGPGNQVDSILAAENLYGIIMQNHASGLAGGSLTNSLAAGNQRDGIAAIVPGATLMYNTATNNGFCGYSIQGVGVNVLENAAFYNGCGIYLDSGAFARNTVVGNGVAFDGNPPGGQIGVITGSPSSSSSGQANIVYHNPPP